VIKRKQKGETVTVEQPEEATEETPDLMAALRASLDAHGKSRRRPASARRKSSPSRRPVRRSSTRR